MVSTNRSFVLCCGCEDRKVQEMQRYVNELKLTFLRPHFGGTSAFSSYLRRRPLFTEKFINARKNTIFNFYKNKQPFLVGLVCPQTADRD